MCAKFRYSILIGTLLFNTFKGKSVYVCEFKYSILIGTLLFHTFIGKSVYVCEI